jgi:hypothetical protein
MMTPLESSSLVTKQNQATITDQIIAIVACVERTVAPRLQAAQEAIAPPLHC